jgi:hypothetical protein
MMNINLDGVTIERENSEAWRISIAGYGVYIVPTWEEEYLEHASKFGKEEFDDACCECSEVYQHDLSKWQDLMDEMEAAEDDELFGWKLDNLINMNH